MLRRLSKHPTALVFLMSSLLYLSSRLFVLVTKHQLCNQNQNDPKLPARPIAIEVWNALWQAGGLGSRRNGTTNSPVEYSYTDKNLASGKYSYRLKQVDYNGNFEYFNLSNEVSVGVPDKFNLSQNYPNPFNPSTTISFDIPVDSKVMISLFDMSGIEVANIVNEFKTAGYYTVNFKGSSLASGAYFYRLVVSSSNPIDAGNFVDTKKMLLVK